MTGSSRPVRSAAVHQYASCVCGLRLLKSLPGARVVLDAMRKNSGNWRTCMAADQSSMRLQRTVARVIDVSSGLGPPGG